MGVIRATRSPYGIMKLRPELLLAVMLGLLLPALETARRGWAHWSVDFTTMFEDYAGGAALLVAAFATWRGARWAPAWMLVAWSGISFMMLLSTVSQLEKQWRGDLEPHSAVVLIVKLALLLISVYATLQSLRRVRAGD